MDISRKFASLVFDEKAMKKYLPSKTYKRLKKCIVNNSSLSFDDLDTMAKAMKHWAVKKGATHYAHKFYPLRDTCAEKQESFVYPQKHNAIMKFTGEQLIKSECDASSFPSGGLRSTSNARGYTTWDPTSLAYIKDGVLYIPATFCSHMGYALDKKTPLIRSVQALNKQCIRLLALLGKKIDHIDIEVGAEQEYFLVDSDIFAKRKDLLYTGRTLFGSVSTQPLGNHYLSEITPKVARFMQELDEELWKLGIPSKTRHNESAPCQHEISPVFTTVNLATDQNQLTIELMQNIAKRHNLTCLLHEKPFEGMNGSGKHNNWSISTKYGNLFDAGKNPQNNIQFLLMLCAVIRAVDTHQDLLRIAVAGASNDLRLGSSEAPPSTISIYLGEELTKILMSFLHGHTMPARENHRLDTGINVLPKIDIDLSDRNRTSPIAFIGNKFEFRMCGASQSIADINTVLNTILAEQFEKFADILQGSQDLDNDIKGIIKQTIKLHGRIIFNGDNYSPLWQKQAEKRGLANFRSSVDALARMTDEKNVELFKRQKVLSYIEIKSRQTIYIQNYYKRIALEGTTMLKMAKNDILPAVIKYKCDLAVCAKTSHALDCDNAYELHLIKELSDLIKTASATCDALSNSLQTAELSDDNLERASFYHEHVIPLMKQLRRICDNLEKLTPSTYKNMPTCEDILFNNE